MNCPSCGRESPAGTKFCMGCGSPLQASPASSEVGQKPKPQNEEKAPCQMPPPSVGGHRATSLKDLVNSSREVSLPDAFMLQHKKLLKVNMAASGGQVIAKVGSMVAFQGRMNFKRMSGGAQQWLKKKISGEQFDLMEVTGEGDLFLADAANDIILLYLNNEALQVESLNLLAFSPSLSWDIVMLKGTTGFITGSGLFTVQLQGTGYLALICKGEPMTLQISPDTPTFTDPNATVAWSEGLNPTIHVEASLSSFRGLLGSRHGELFQLSFQGNGYVIIQPSEEAVKSSLQEQGGGGGGAGGILGGVFGR